jgi:hypothetical protein
MASQKIVFVAVPGGIRTVSGSRRGRVSVYVSPRLQPDNKRLSGDFLDWPKAMQDKGASFRVKFGNVVKNATIASPTTLGLWTALFNRNTFVRPHVSDVIMGLYGSYPAARIHDLIKTVYQDTAIASFLKPPADGLAPALASISQLFRPNGDDVGVAPGSDDDARVALARELFRPTSDDGLRAKLDRLVDLATVEAKANSDGTPRSTEIIPDIDDRAVDLARLLLFHSQPLGSASFAAAAADDKRVDFHQQLANLGEYPKLQRKLGLIIDLDVDLTGVPATTSGPGMLRVEPKFTADLSPHTEFVVADSAYTLTATTFRSAPGESPSLEIVEGLLNLGLTVGPGSTTPQFRLVQVDVDTAARGVIAMLRHTAAEREGGRGELATLRSAGVSIVRYGNGRFLMDAIGIGLAKMEQIAQGAAGVALFAEDLIRGYRIDVKDRSAGVWRSLHLRDGIYTFTSTGNKTPISDEGFLQPSVVQPATAGSSTIAADVPAYIPESLFCWQGWSLAAGRPARVMPQPPAVPAVPDPVSEVKLDVVYGATPKTLPRLRFGRRYDFRVRLVDLVGEGVPSADADVMSPAPVLPRPGEEFRYLRFDAVPSPVVIPRIEPGLGAEAERIVLRSNHATTPDAYAQQHPQLPEYALSGDRHIVAPKAWQLLAEASGKLDTSIGSGTGPDLDRTFRLIERATRSLAKLHAEESVTVPYLPDPLAAGVALTNLPGVPPGVVGVVVEGQLRLDGRLPEGGSESEITSVVTVPFDGVWPDLRGFLLRLREGSGAPQWDSGRRVLSVFLPKAASRTIGVSSTLRDAAALETLGMWDWLTERLDQLVAEGLLDGDGRAARITQLQTMALLGQSWMLTPQKEIVLAHVVQQPVTAPTLRLDIVRLPGSTHALLKGAIKVHGASSGQVELRATGAPPALKAPFMLPPDGTNSPAPVPGHPLPVATFDATDDEVTIHGPDIRAMEETLAVAVKKLVDDWDGLVDAAKRVRPFNAAARRDHLLVQGKRSDFLATLTGFDSGTFLERWASVAQAGNQSHQIGLDLIGFPEPVPDTLNNEDLNNSVVGIVGHPQAGIPGNALDLAVLAQGLPTKLEGFTARHDFEDTKHHRVTYEAVATSRFGDCFPSGPTSTLDFTRKSTPLVVEVPSTATPPPPRVSHIVPVFEWKRQGSVAGPGFSSQRIGGLRVYLDGPWFASGDGELLGVAVSSRVDGGSVIELGRTIVASNWARDPLWDSDSIRNLPAKGNFREGRAFDSVLLPDQPRFSVTIVGYPVHDDEGRHYSDVLLDPTTSYYPFVRLALTRFQPDSLRGRECSTVVLTDFTQLTPTRSVTVQRRQPRVLDVAVSGLTHRSATDPAVLGASDRTGTRVKVTVQRRIRGTSDDAGWLPDGPAIELQRASQTWSGTVQIPDDPAGALRLLIEEIEDHAVMRQSATDPASRERVVYAETVPI